MRPTLALRLITPLSIIAAACGSSPSSVTTQAPTTTITTTTAAAEPSTSPPATTQPPASSTAPTSSTSAPTTTTPVAELESIATAISSGWDATVLRASDTGGPSLHADNGVNALILGQGFSGCCYSYPAAWSQVAEGTWDDLSFPDEVPGGEIDANSTHLVGSGPLDLIVVGTTYMAVGGEQILDAQGEQADIGPMIWTSNDGRNWDARMLPGSEFSFATSLVEGADGTLWTITDDGFGTVELLYSDTGQTWTSLKGIDIATAHADALGYAGSGASARIGRVGQMLVIRSDVGPVLMVSEDNGASWSMPDGGMAAGNIVFTNDGALMLTDDSISRSRDGHTWVQIGGIPDGPLDDGTGIDSGPDMILAVDLGDTTFLINNRPFADHMMWVAAPGAEWVAADTDPAFGPTDEGPTMINSLQLDSAGDLVALGWLPVPFEGNKPLEDYVVWVHHPVN